MFGRFVPKDWPPLQIEDKFGSSASLMKLACLLERINGPLFVHRKMIVLW